MKLPLSQIAAVMITQQNFCNTISINSSVFMAQLQLAKQLTFLYAAACEICVIVTIPNRIENRIAAPNEG